MATARDDPLRAARQALGDELAGGRWALLPKGAPRGALGGDQGTARGEPRPAAGGPEPAAESPEGVSERLRKFRELKAARASAAPAAGAAAGPAAPAEAVYRRGLSASREPSVFGEKPLTDPARPAAERLAELARLAGQCDQCALNRTRNKVVFGDGPAGAELLFVGEAPGADEDATGVPFVGRAGQLLNKIIAAMGLKRGEVYICNVLKCRPPGNRTPLPSEAAECWPYLREQIELVGPRVICALGAPAVRTLLGSEEPIGRLRGYVHDYHGTPLVASYHPAYLLRNPPEKAKVWEDMKAVLKLLGRPVPKTGKAAGA